MEDAKCCAAPKPGDQQNCCPSNMVCYNCPGKNCECVTGAELQRLEFEAKMQGKATEQLPPVGRPATASVDATANAGKFVSGTRSCPLHLVF